VVSLVSLFALAPLPRVASASRLTATPFHGRQHACTVGQLRDTLPLQPDSIVVTRYPGGAKKLEIPMKDGAINGMMVAWYESGEKEADMPYRNNLAEGMHVRYYKNGRVQSESLFIRGRKEGVEVLYHENGRKWKEIPFLHGEAVGTVREWK
jgi:antitoxin component YwqK of YwqJK toxin-antitoxin module